MARTAAPSAFSTAPRPATRAHTLASQLAPPSYVPTVRTATWMSASEVSAPPTAGRAAKRDKQKLNHNLGRNAALRRSLFGRDEARTAGTATPNDGHGDGDVGTCDPPS